MFSFKCRTCNGYFMLTVVAATKLVIGTKIYEQNFECFRRVGGIRCPNIHSEIGHGRSINGIGGKRDTNEIQLAVTDHIIVGYFQKRFFCIRKLPAGIPGIYGAVGVLVAVHRNHVSSILRRYGCRCGRKLRRTSAGNCQRTFSVFIANLSGNYRIAGIFHCYFTGGAHFSNRCITA